MVGAKQDREQRLGQLRSGKQQKQQMEQQLLSDQEQVLEPPRSSQPWHPPCSSQPLLTPPAPLGSTPVREEVFRTPCSSQPSLSALSLALPHPLSLCAVVCVRVRVRVLPLCKQQIEPQRLSEQGEGRLTLLSPVTHPLSHTQTRAHTASSGGTGGPRPCSPALTARVAVCDSVPRGRLGVGDGGGLTHRTCPHGIVWRMRRGGGLARIVPAGHSWAPWPLTVSAWEGDGSALRRAVLWDRVGF